MYFKTAAILEKSIMGAQSCLPCNGFFLSPQAGVNVNEKVNQTLMKK